MKQRLLLSLCAILCSVATWAVTFSSGQFKYSASGSTAEITGYNSSYSSSQLQNLVIPHTVTYNGITYRVSKVGGLGASAYPKTVRVEYGEYDVTINKDAFKGCSNLTTVELTSCVYQILADAFKDCSKLKEVYVSKQSALLGSAAIFNSKVTVYIPYSADLNAHKASTIFNSSYVTLVQSIAPYDFKAEGCALLQNGNSTYNEVTVVFRIATTSTTWEIPASVAYGGQSWKVVSISPKANNVADSNLKTLVVRSPLTSIGVSAFQGNKNLTSVTISGIVNLVDSYAFKNCSSLTTTQLAGIKQLGVEVFSGCTSLKTLNFGAASIGTLDNTALTGITNLENIEINTTKYQSVNGWLYNYGKTTLLFCPPANTKNGWVKTVKNIGAGAFAGTKQNIVYIPYGVTTINQGIFEGSTALRDAIIPGSVTNWAMTNAFKGCTSLETVVCNMKSVPTAYDNTFANSSCKSATVLARRGLADSYKNANYWKQFKGFTDFGYDFANGYTRYTVLTSNTAEITIFTHTSDLRASVTDDVGNTYTVTSIGAYACDPNGEASIITGDFSCNTITNVGDYAFQDCKRLTSISLPNVKTIGEGAFYGCSGLQTMTLPNTVTTLGDYAFTNCQSLTSVKLSYNLKRVGNETFSGCESLTGVKIPWGVTSLGYGLFSGCKKLIDVWIPSSVTSIAVDKKKDGMFWGCEKLSRVFMNIRTPLATSPDDKNFSPYRGDLLRVYVPKGSVKAYSTHDNYQKVLNLIKEGSYDVSRSGGYGVTECFDVKSWDAGMNRGEVIWANEICQSSNDEFAVDCSKRVTDDWDRQFVITEIGERAFDGSGSNTSQTGEHGYMTQLNLDDVKKIGASAFRGVSMPAGQPGMITIMGPSTRYLEIGEYAFADMRNVYLILIDGLADYNYRTNMKLGFGCFGNSYGNNAMTNVCVPKSDGKMFYDMMREWETKDQSSSNRRYTDQLGCIYHPGENLKDGVAIEEFPFAVSFEGLGLEAHILATKAPYLTDHIITAADKGWSVMLKSDKWSDSYLLLHPSKLPLIDGTVQKYEYINVNGATHLDDLSNGDVVYYYESYGDITGDGGQMKKLDNVNDIGKLPAGTIYVILPESVTHGAAVITPDVVVDGIAEVRAALNSDGRLYNLRGQRVDRPTKPGLYIVGGRKVILK